MQKRLAVVKNLFLARKFLMYLGRNYIGKFEDHRSDFDSLNPSTNEVVGKFPQTTKDFPVSKEMHFAT